MYRQFKGGITFFQYDLINMLFKKYWRELTGQWTSLDKIKGMTKKEANKYINNLKEKIKEVQDERAR